MQPSNLTSFISNVAQFLRKQQLEMSIKDQSFENKCEKSHAFLAFKFHHFKDIVVRVTLFTYSFCYIWTGNVAKIVDKYKSAEMKDQECVIHSRKIECRFS